MARACDGKDLRPWVFPASTAGTPAAPLRHALCGHHTQRPTAPTMQRYLLTRPGSVGRCTDLDGASMRNRCRLRSRARSVSAATARRAPSPRAPDRSSAPADRRAWAAAAGWADPRAASTMRTARPIFPGGHFACAEPETKWCRNAPDVRCGIDADCPVCPAGPGPTPPPCSRLCEARQLKLYISTPSLEMTSYSSSIPTSTACTPASRETARSRATCRSRPAATPAPCRGSSAAWTPGGRPARSGARAAARVRRTSCATSDRLMARG